MSCVGCGKPREVKDTGPQRSVAFRAEVYDGELRSVVGCSPDDFDNLPDFPTLTLGVRLEFSDGTSRTVSGHRWTYLIEQHGSWTIDDDTDANLILLKYPRAICKPGGTVVESVMQEVNRRIQEPIG